MVLLIVTEVQHRLGSRSAVPGPARRPVHGDRFELIAQPTLRLALLRLQLDRSVGVYRHRPPEGPAIQLAFDVGAEAGEILPDSPRRQRLLEQLDRRGIGILGAERPGEGQRRELTYLLVLPPVVLAGFLRHPRGVDGETAAIR